MKISIEDIINQVQLNTKCIMNNTIYEVIEIHPYSDVCSTPQYNMIAIDSETIEERKQELNRFNKNNPYHNSTLEKFLTIEDIEPMWFISRNVKILN
jgi:hypothetical protein